MELETVEIVNPDAKSGFTRINLADFDPERHVLVGSDPEGDDQQSEPEGDDEPAATKATRGRKPKEPTE